jgi:predicted O-methyltransferase YrrM
MAADKYRPHNQVELSRLLEWVRGANSILEIGSRYGYVLVDMAHASTHRGRIVAVDLPGYGPWGEADSESTLIQNVQTLKSERFDARLFLADSRNVVEEVKALGPYDFAFIDGDHRYEGVKADWENYGPLAKIVVFHDIVKPKAGERQELGVWRLWEEIRKTHKTEEFIAPGSKMGIGKVG